MEVVEERLQMLRARIDAELEKARAELSSIVKRSTVHIMAAPEETERNQSIRRLASSDDISARYLNVLRASNIRSNRHLADELGISQTLMSMYARGERPIPRERALKAQELTRSDKYKEGLEPNGHFWRKGVV